MNEQKQVDKSHYNFRRYVSKNHRWVSFYHQLDEIFTLAPSSVLEVGPGMPLVRDMLAYHSPKTLYHSLDIAEDLNPDVVGSVTAIPLADNSYDLVCAFQILEHIPFEAFPVALRELARVSKKDVLISIPHFGPAFQLMLKIPLLPRVRMTFKFPYPIKHTFNGQHYWEVGKYGYPPALIRKSISTYFTIKKEYIPFENQCHRFYVLEKK